MTQFKITLYWDQVEVGHQIVNALDWESLEQAGHTAVRLEPNSDRLAGMWPLHESTYLRVDIEKIDSAGRRLTR